MAKAKTKTRADLLRENMELRAQLAHGYHNAAYDADEAEREAERAAMPARLALALAAALPFLGSSKPSPGCRVTAHQQAGINAREVLDDYRGMLIDADCQRDLTEEEAEALRVLSGGDA